MNFILSLMVIRACINPTGFVSFRTITIRRTVLIIINFNYSALTFTLYLIKQLRYCSKNSEVNPQNVSKVNYSNALTSKLQATCKNASHFSGKFINIVCRCRINKTVISIQSIRIYTGLFVIYYKTRLFVNLCGTSQTLI